MLSKFKIGDKKIYEKKVNLDDIAEFESGAVHQVYATFALGRDAEWSSRLFVLEMKEDDEEGIGTFLNITHRSPALVGETVSFEAEITALDKNKIDCKVTARVNNRIIADCETGQKIIKKEKLNLLFESLRVHER
jgi:fluoroacetyl-CoA thioesterase